MLSFKNGLLGAAAALAFGAAATFSHTASAVTFSPCVGTGFDISGQVSNAIDCTISDDFNQDFLNTDPLTVNESPGFFGITDWMFGGKIGSDAGFDGQTGGQSGSFDITAGANAIMGNILNTMLVFKSGNGTTLVGYLIDGFVGSWETPFSEPPFDFPGMNDKDVSHISVYFQKGPNVVPLPAALPLFAGAIGFVGFVSRRRKVA